MKDLTRIRRFDYGARREYRKMMLTLSHMRKTVAYAAQAATAKPCRQDLVRNESRFGNVLTLAERRMR